MRVRSPWRICGGLLTVGLLAMAAASVEESSDVEARVMDLSDVMISGDGVVLLQDGDPTADAVVAVNMDDAQLAELRANEEAAQAAQKQIAAELSFETAILKNNETQTADWFQEQVEAVQANFTARLASERFRLMRPYIDQAAEYIASKFQEAAVVKEVAKIIQKDLDFAVILRGDNLQQIADASAEHAEHATNETVQDFIHDAMEEVHYRHGQHPLVSTNESVSVDTSINASVDATSLAPDPDGVDLNPPPVEDLGETMSQPESPEEKEERGEPEQVVTKSWIDDVAPSIYNWWPTSTVPGVEPSDAPSERGNATMDAYNTILDLGINSTQGVRATKVLKQKQARTLFLAKMKEKEEDWGDIIESEAKVLAFAKVNEKQNASMSVIIEHLRTDLNLNENETQFKIKEHLIENRVDASTPEGHRITYEYSQMCSEMRLTDDVIENAREELSRQTQFKVMPRYLEAYKPVADAQEKAKLHALTKTTADSVVDGRLQFLRNTRKAAEDAKAAALAELNSAVDGQSVAQARAMAAVEGKMNDALTLVKQYGTSALATRLETAMQSIISSRAAVSSGSLDAVSTAAAAQKEFDDALALASASITGDAGDQLLSLKIQIDTAKSDDGSDDLENAAMEVMNNPLNITV